MEGYVWILQYLPKYCWYVFMCFEVVKIVNWYVGVKIFFEILLFKIVLKLSNLNDNTRRIAISFSLYCLSPFYFIRSLEAVRKWFCETLFEWSLTYTAHECQLWFCLQGILAALEDGRYVEASCSHLCCYLYLGKSCFATPFLHSSEVQTWVM